MRSFSHTLVSALALALVPTLAVAQLSGSVGPLTSASTKAATKTCDVTDYGAVADQSTDLGPPLTSAFADCKTGGVVVIPEGDYALATWATLSGGSAWALQLDGTIYRTGTDGGNMIFIEHASDFELFSSTGAGAFQGLGYEFHVDGSISGPRILRFYEVSDFSVHDLALVDSPSFHFSMDTCSNGEVYNMAIRGGYSGGLDGIDVWSTNMWIHDVMVTNKDECVTVKSPASNILIENIYCNWSGGCAFGSLGADTDISEVTYRNVYTVSSNQMMMIKSNGGSGTVSDVVLESFIGRENAYSLDIDQYWSSQSTADGDGVQLNNITISNWKGTEADGAERGPIKIICADATPCTDITITDFAMWTAEGSTQWYACESAYGSGFCLQEDSGSAVSYAVTTTTVSSAPSGYSASTMAEDLTTDFGTTASIPIPTLPASFFPGVAPISAFASASAAAEAVVSSSSVAAVTTSAAAAATSVAAVTSYAPSSSTLVQVVTSSASSSAAAATSSAATTLSPGVSTGSSSSSSLSQYAQCGGTGWAGEGSCVAGSTCKVWNDYYSQCV